MIKEMELVSVITPLYNAEAYIKETIESVLAQTYHNWELLIIDDCSTDTSYEIAKDYADLDKRIKVTKLAENCGAAIARNTGIELAKGRFIAFIDSDDIWTPGKLSRQIDFMLTNDFPLSFTAYERTNESGEFINNVGVPKQVDYNSLLKCDVIGCFTAMYDIQYFGKVLMPNMLKRQDYAFFLNLLKMTKYAYGLNENHGKYRVRVDSLSANKLNAALHNWNLYRNIEKLSLPKSIYIFSQYAVRGVLRTNFPKFAKMLGVLH